METKLTEQRQQNFLNQFILGTIVKIGCELLSAFHFRWRQRAMWIRHLRNGVRIDMAKLSDTVLVVERFPTFAR